jgi:alpha-2-macroglobulin
MEDSIVERFTAIRDYAAGNRANRLTTASMSASTCRTKRRTSAALFLLHIRSAPPEKHAAENEDGGEDGYSSGGIEDTRLILVTDLGFIVKQSNDGSRDVFVQSIQPRRPVSGARIEVIGRNGEPVAAATTDATGRAQFPKLPNLQREKLPC